MDPNEALRRAREAAGILQDADDDGNFTDPETTNLGQLIESFNALDDWLTKGGFLPYDWRPKSPPKKAPVNRVTFCSSHSTKELCNESGLAHRYLKAGDLAWYDALWGPSKVKIERIDKNHEVHFVFTADAGGGGYLKGNHESTNAIWIQPRTALKVKSQKWDGVPVWFEVTDAEF